MQRRPQQWYLMIQISRENVYSFFFVFISLLFPIFTYYISQCQTHSNEDKTSFLLFSYFFVNIAASWWAMCFLLLRRRSRRWVWDAMALMVFLEYCILICLFFGFKNIFVIVITSKIKFLKKPQKYIYWNKKP